MDSFPMSNNFSFNDSTMDELSDFPGFSPVTTTTSNPGLYDNQPANARLSGHQYFHDNPLMEDEQPTNASFFENQSPVDDDRCPMEALMDLHDESKPIIKQEIKQEPIREPQATIYNLKVKTEPNTNNAATNIRSQVPYPSSNGALQRIPMTSQTMTSQIKTVPYAAVKTEPVKIPLVDSSGKVLQVFSTTTNTPIKMIPTNTPVKILNGNNTNTPIRVLNPANFKVITTNQSPSNQTNGLRVINTLPSNQGGSRPQIVKLPLNNNMQVLQRIPSTTCQISRPNNVKMVTTGNHMQVQPNARVVRPLNSQGHQQIKMVTSQQSIIHRTQPQQISMMNRTYVNRAQPQVRYLKQPDGTLVPITTNHMFGSPSLAAYLSSLKPQPPRQPPQPKKEYTASDLPPFSDMTVKLNNVVARLRVGCHLNMRHIATESIDVEYKMAKQKVTMKMKNPKCTAYMWSSGKVVCTGSNSAENSKKSARKYVKRLKKIGYKTAKLSGYKIVNVLASTKFPFEVDLQEFGNGHSDHSYEPEIHPAASFKCDVTGAAVKVFSTGSVTATARSIEKVKQGFRIAYEHCKPFFKYSQPNDFWSTYQPKVKVEEIKTEVKREF